MSWYLKFSMDDDVDYHYHYEEQDVIIHAYGCQPHLIDESEELRYWAGGYRKVKKCRIGLTIVVAPFETRGTFDKFHGNKTYWDFMKLIYTNSDIYLYEIGDNFERLNQDNLQGEFQDFVLPMAVEIYDIGELQSDFENNRDRTNITLCSKEWFEFDVPV